MESVPGPSRDGVEPRPRQARAESTRTTLLVAAARRFASGGYEGTSLREVLADAGLTKGALYFHFADKQALADAVIAEMIALWRRNDAQMQAAGLDPLAKIVIGFGRIADQMLNDPIARGGTRLLNDPLVPTALAVEHYGFAEEATRRELRVARDLGLVRPAVDVDLLARTIVVLVAGHNLIAERTGTLDELPDRIATMWDALLPVVATDDWLVRHRQPGAGDAGAAIDASS